MKLANNQVVNLPNKKVVTYSFKGQIPESLVISKKSRDAHVLKDIHSSSLISLVQLCDVRCTNILNKKRIHVFKYTHLVLSVMRNKMDGLWDIPLTAPVPSTSTIQYFQLENAITHFKNTKKNFISMYMPAVFVQL